MLIHKKRPRTKRIPVVHVFTETLYSLDAAILKFLVSTWVLHIEEFLIYIEKQFLSSNWFGKSDHEYIFSYKRRQQQLFSIASVKDTILV